MPASVALLDAQTVNQIAAGEVVERPSSVVKELIENALDAAATRIEITVESGGRERIRVADDGHGMSPDDAILALERHATSKIRSADDLLQVTSLGFRGEALPSIASVSRLTLITGQGEAGRTVIVTRFGSREDPRSVAGDRGTEVIVEDLFENTPARLKFLKGDATESSSIAETVAKYAIAHPSVAFVLRFGESESIRTTGTGDLIEAIGGVWGSELARNLIPIESNSSGIEVRGFVSPPHMTKPNRAFQQFIVNGRPVRSRTLYASIDAAFRSLTPERRYPVVVLQLNLDPADVDINVSPTKSEIKFRREGAAFEAIRLAVKSSLMENGIMPSVAAAFVPTTAAVGGSTVSSPALLEPIAQTVRDLFDERAPMDPVQAVKYPFLDLLDGLQILGQVLDTFIVASTDRGLVIIDQHVAHERILYEYLCGLKEGAPIERQGLLEPQVISFDRPGAIALAEHLEDLRAIGFELEKFGVTDFAVRAIPGALSDKGAIPILKDIAEELVATGGKSGLQDARHRIWITAACRMAVKAGDVLADREMEQLVRELAETENPYLCPHGRPITLTFTYDELLRRFKRT